LQLTKPIALEFPNTDVGEIPGTSKNLNGTMIMVPPHELIDVLNVTGSDLPFSGDCNVYFGWKCRPFHPKWNGYAAIKDTVINQLNTDRVPGVKL
jgi:hypothetical protein